MTPAPSDSPPAGLAVEEESDSGMAKSPEGLTLEGVYRKLKLETHGLDDGIVGLESKDTDYGVNNGVLYFLDYEDNLHHGPLCSRFEAVVNSSL